MSFSMPEHIEIKNASGQTVAFLSPDDGLKNCYIDVRLNGESTLEFMLPANSEKLVEIAPECRIVAGGREFVLLKEDAIDFERTEDNKLWAKIMAVESWYLLDTKYPEPYITNDPNTPIPADLAVIIVGGGSDLSGGRYAVGSAGHALYAVLNGSGWYVGTVDVTGIHDLEMEKVSRLELVKAIQETWGGYLVWDSINKTVSLRDANTWQPYNGFQIRYAKNLKHITRTQSNRLVTKLYCFGHDDIDIASVNGGVKYITNFSYTSREYVGIYKNQDIYDAQELKEKATAELSLICRPRYLYKVKIADLRTLPEYSHEDFALGDMADVIDPDVAPDSPRVRIIRHKYNVFKPWECELELGDPEERLVEQLKASFNTTGFIDGKFNGSGKSSGYSIEDLTITNGKIVNLDAAKITTGYLSADRIQANSIGADKIKTNELVVGDNIAMGPNARISWSQVTSKPDIPVLPSYIKSTYIDSTTVQSPTIIGGQIIGGSITSNSTIDVTTDAYIGNNLYLGNTGARSIVFNSGVSITDDGDWIGYGLTLSCNTLVHHGHVDGWWDFYENTVTGLEDSGYATQAWVNSQGFLKQTSGFSGTKVIDGETYTFENGLLKSIA